MYKTMTLLHILYKLGILWMVIVCVHGDVHKMLWLDTYDFIIVGGGTAGSVVAARLSEDEEVSVLVLEAGGEATDPFIRIPRAWAIVTRTPEFDWGYITEPQMMSPTNKSIHCNCGKLLGGSSSHNGVYYSRGSPHDFDRWADMGNYNWSYNALLPYFKKSEMMQDPDLAANGYHGINGMMKTRVLENVPIVEEFIKAGVEMGFEELEDGNGPTLEGISRIQTNVDEKGERSGAYEAFLKPVRCRRNLDVIINAHVTKVSFTKDDHTHADGVYFEKDGNKYFIKASREIILCSGALGSPTILLHSGIGPRDHLESIGIPVIKDLPVGDNLQNHVAVVLTFYLNESTPVELENTFTFEALFDQLFVGKGPWSDESLVFAYYKSNTQPTTDLFPYIELNVALPYLFVSEPFSELDNHVRSGKKITKEMVKKMIDTEKGNIPVSVNVVQLHPRDSGTVRLQSSDPKIKPKITYNYLYNGTDVRELIQGIRDAQKFINTNVMQSVEALPITEADPYCNTHEFDSDNYWECYIYNNFVAYYHFSSTVKMAPDSTGVVDDRLRVKGVSGLRVADNSIMPILTSGHTHAPAVMIGEKAADMIKMDMSRKGKPQVPSSTGSLLLTDTIIYGLVYIFLFI